MGDNEELKKARRSCGKLGGFVEPLLKNLEELMENPGDKADIRKKYDKLKEKFEKYEQKAEDVIDNSETDKDKKHNTITDFNERNERMEEVTNQVREYLSGTEWALPAETQCGEASAAAVSATGGQQSNVTSGISGRVAYRGATVTSDRKTYVEGQLAILELEQLEERQKLEKQQTDLAQKLACMKLDQAKKLAEYKVQLWQQEMKEQ